MLGIDDAALATILAGAISTAGSLYANRKNIDAQRDANAINWEIARQNNATQIEMANTAHQREVRDLRAAGLNPILSAGGNGSSVPSLSTASINPVHTDNAFEGLANSAKGLSRFFGQTYKANLKAAEADASLASLDALRARMVYGAEFSQAENDYIMSEMRNTALREEFGIGKIQRDKQGMPDATFIDRPERWDKAVELMRDGIRSDMRDNASTWWRNDIQAIGSGVNSAAGAVRSFRKPVLRSYR